MSILKTLFPPKCAACRRVISGNGRGGVCSACRERLEALYSPHKLYFDNGIESCTVLFPYDDELIKTMLFRLKRRAPKKLVYVMAEYFARAVKADCELSGADYICFLPRRRKAVSDCGFDQSRLLAICLSELCAIPFEESLETLRHSERQHSLTGAKRRENVRGLYGARGVLGGSHIIVDDIVTSGASATAAAKAVRRGGANRVFFIAFAH